MRFQAFLLSAFAAFSIAGCGSPNPAGGVAPAMLSARSTDAIFTPLLYAAGPNTNEVDAYPAFAKNPNPVNRITAGVLAPAGLAVDATGNVYVADNAGQGVKGHVFWTVTVYARGGSSIIRTYKEGVKTPTDVAVGADGTVYVANLVSAVTVYAPGSLHPSRTLEAPSGDSPVAVAADAKGNVFVSYVNQTSGAIYDYAPGRTQGRNLGISFSGNPHGLALDRSGDLIVAVSNAPNPGSSVEVFAPGSIKPKLTLSGPFQPFMIALDRKEGRLFVADYGSGNDDGGVYVYSYPAGTLLYKDTAGAAAGAYGVAIDPRDP